MGICFDDATNGVQHRAGHHAGAFDVDLVHQDDGIEG
jgi:hypothetical protein